ncbi:response regulator [Desulfococcaceae bacterium HSG8]|nr:response regulator [Desulfococcaceae bacterium HSG8]
MCTNHVSRFTFHVSRFTFHVSRFTFHVSRFMFHVSRFTSHLSPFTSLTFHFRGLPMPLKVLIVDDEPNIVVPLQFLMEQNGYDVMVAESGEQAMDIVPEFRPDLILLDIMLPVLDGFGVCQMVRENPDWQDTKIILITAMGRDEVNITKGLALGADAYITKPFSNSEVVEKVKELLGN